VMTSTTSYYSNNNIIIILTTIEQGLVIGSQSDFKNKNNKNNKNNNNNNNHYNKTLIKEREFHSDGLFESPTQCFWN
jgi:hypothetical protein